MILSHVSVHSAACLPFFLIKLNLLVFLSEGSTSISTETLFSISYSGCRFYLCLVLPRKWLLRDWLGISLLVGGAECLPLHHLDYFLRFSSMYTSVFILIYEFFSLFLSQFSPASHCGGEQVTSACLVAGKGQHITYEESLTFFQKFAWYDTVRNPATSTI